MPTVQHVELKDMKKNRSNKYTTGLVITNNTNDKRFLFFEIDTLDAVMFSKVLDIYRNFGLDLCVHRSHCGWHFVSPSLLSVETWKEAMAALKDINKKCPMTTLRWLPNKYPNEEQIWFLNLCRYDTNNIRNNSDQLCKLLNHTFGAHFEGLVNTDLKFVRYPLP